jgi:hypothetical protein
MRRRFFDDFEDIEDRYWPRDLLEDYEETEYWHDQPATERQLEALERRGYDPPASLTKGQACYVMKLATAKQRRALERRGLWEAGMTFEEARKALSALARKEGWG